MQKIDGVVDARADYGRSTVDDIYDQGVASREMIIEAVKRLDYRVLDHRATGAASASGDPAAPGRSKGAPERAVREALPLSHLLGIGIIVLA